MPTKLPSDILKFEGKVGDDHANHIMTFHLWCSSNNIMDDSIRLRLFQCTLTGASTKWYVKEKPGSHATFESLAKAFLTFFQLPIRHDNGLELLSDFKQTTSTHIAYHIHKWHWHCSLYKANATPNSVSIGSSNHLFPSLPKMWPPPSPRLKKKPLERPNSSNSSMPSPDTYTRYSQMPQDPFHLAKTNLGCLTQQMD
jgi:hypothetical protein